MCVQGGSAAGNSAQARGSSLKQFVLFGAHGIFASEVVESVHRLGGEVAYGIMTGKAEWNLAGLGSIIREDELVPEVLELPIIIPMVGSHQRRKLVERARAAGFVEFANIVDPTSVVAATATLTLGNYVNAATVIGAGVDIAEHAFVNRSASIGHHSLIEQFATIGPAVSLASRCHVARGASLGVGAVVCPEVRIGENAFVGAGAVAIADVPDNAVVVGNPARVLRMQTSEDGEG
jgi:sugar O-acyltransferase (sialic acid O-acetyltransferase NeuD family)